LVISLVPVNLLFAVTGVCGLCRRIDKTGLFINYQRSFCRSCILTQEALTTCRPSNWQALL